MNDSPTKNMRFDVLSVDEGQNVLYNLPDLKRLDSFVEYPGSPGGELNQDKVIKYVVLLYSEDSILNKRPAIDLPDRKLMAAEYAGFERNKNGEFEVDVVEKLFNLNSFETLRMIHEFLIFQKKHLWTEICTLEQEYDEFIRLRLEPVSDEKDNQTLAAAERKGKLRKDCKDIRTELISLYKEFFTDNSDVQELHHVKDKVSLEKRARKA
jgi:hypothetical protein